MIDIMENKVLGPAILKGMLKGKVAILTRQLETRFGTVPEWVAEKLGSAQEAELMEWCVMPCTHGPSTRYSSASPTSFHASSFSSAAIQALGVAPKVRRNISTKALGWR
jgi:hypothetical protein